MNIAAIYELFLAHPNVTTDTRKITEGAIFFALKGPNFNGNNFAANALAQGAAYCICDEKQPTNDHRIIYTDDVLTTLQAIAKHHRQQFNIPFIAITGSNGKTTTKELVHAVLSEHYKCYTTVGNLNNHIGVPLTILSIKKDAEIAIIEMGANHQKEIESYCTYTLPTHGLITNCGKAHLEGFGGVEGVRKGKGELFKYLASNNGTAIINTDLDYLVPMSAGIKNIVTYGTQNGRITGFVKNDAHFVEVSINHNETLQSIHTQLAGGYNIANILSAVCIGKLFNVPDEKIKNALEHYTPSNSRSQIIIKDTNTIILDAYNANPSSMKAAIENFAHMEGNKKVVIIGGMMELGEDSVAEHTAIIKLLQKYHWYHVVLAGKDYVNVPETYLKFDDASAIANWYHQQQFENTHILIKGSRAMAMEKVLG
ncbi:UDP-N-acetylmuramoyl-tripeptide--D-alanyl-D-alanine ligase [Ferruginibacter yonginensis]|uniref:UDP-N-acetylmuramoyl-tripeptide--D-alanyl-D-alanine ligase n=1 Tax=Ferruginibacter yonginensis TaxID=1310416 RepID=A0ABV8QTQ1_9BACT